MPAKSATAKTKAKTPKKVEFLGEDEQARKDQEDHYAEQAAKDDPAYEGETENTAPYMNAYE